MYVKAKAQSALAKALKMVQSDNFEESKVDSDVGSESESSYKHSSDPSDDQ